MAGPTDNGDTYLTRREAEILIESSAEQVLARWTAHEAVHKSEKAAVDVAVAAVAREHVAHATAHAAAHEAHAREHLLDHQSEADRSGAHGREHVAEAAARDRAAMDIDKRLVQMNEIREQLRDQARLFATSERVEQMQMSQDQRFADTMKHTDQRYEENRRRIETLEKGDIKGEGRSLGQGATIAAIIATVTFVATILGIIIVIANVLTSP